MDLETFRAIDVDIDLANDFVPDVILSANDYNGRCIVARVTNGGVSVSGDNLSARLLFNTAPGISPGGYVTMTRVASSPTATWQVPVPSDALAARQVMLCVQIVDSDDNLVCSRNFRGIVDRKLMDDDAPESVNELNRLWEGIDALENIDASVTADGTVSVTAPDGTVTTSTAVPTAVSAANSATSAANTAAGAANTAATDAAQAVAALQAYVPLDADNILKASETGVIVSVTDAYPSPLLGLTVYGNSIQDGTPTPESPVPIKSVAGAQVCATGKNMIPRLDAGYTSTANGVTMTVNNDSSVTLTGTSTSDGWVEFALIGSSKHIVLQKGMVITHGLFGNANSDIRILARKNSTQGNAWGSRITTGGTLTIDSTAFLVLKVTVAAGATVNDTVYPYVVAGSDIPDTWPPMTLSFSDALTPLTLIDDQGVAHELRSLPDGTRDDLIWNADGSGTLVENCPAATVDGSEGDWVVGSAQVGRFQKRSSELGLPDIHTSSYAGGIRSSNYELTTNTYATMPYGTIKSGNVNAHSFIYLSVNSSITTNADLLAFLSEHPFTVVVKAYIPRTYHIPAINMPSLPDLVSNAWVSATDADGAAIACECAIEYRRDINKVIGDIEEAIADIVSQ